MKFWQIGILLFCSTLIAAIAQEPSPDSGVRTWTDRSVSPAATIKDLRWLEGDWEGPNRWWDAAIFDLHTHERSYARLCPRLGQDGSIWFYEINDFIEVNGTVEFPVKHFSGGLPGWEGSEYIRLGRRSGRTGFQPDR
jgi:hypothetical protein